MIDVNATSKKMDSLKTPATYHKIMLTAGSPLGFEA